MEQGRRVATHVTSRDTGRDVPLLIPEESR